MGQFLRPDNLSDALDALSRAPLTVLAGGTDFYPARVGRPLDDDVLDISRVDALCGVTEAAGQVRIGALTTWTQIVETPLPPLFDALKVAAREVGGWQVQNAGTIAGNICNASPAADGVPPLLALDASVELASARGTRAVPLDGFIVGNRRTVRAPDEIVTAIVVPRPANTARSTFLKLGARKYLVISIVMVAAAIEVADDATIAAARVAVGACSPVAQRLPALEAALVGRTLSADLGTAVRAEHLAPLTPIDDVRGTAGYRAEAAATLLRRALRRLGTTP